MADIEDTAKLYAGIYTNDNEFPESYDGWEESLIDAYLAGSAQTRNPGVPE